MSITASEAPQSLTDNKDVWKNRFALSFVIGTLIMTVVWVAFLVTFTGYVIGLWL
jgi:hypothetical protein